MKITDVETILVQVKLAKPSWSAATLFAQSRETYAAYRAVVLVKVHTDEGLVGIGQAHGNVETLPPVRTALDRVIKPHLLGQDPFFVEGIWDRVYRSTFMNGRKGVMISALSAADIALWDLMGKATGQPIYRLLGACRDRVMGYATGGFYEEGKTPADLGDEMAGYAARGFKAAKMKFAALPLKQDLQRARAAREAVGDEMLLMVDANRAYDVKGAIKAARGLEELDYSWLEEPISPDDVAGSAAVVAATSIPIAGYETESTAFGFRDLILRRAVDIVQPDLVWHGGFTECRKITSLAATFGMKATVHAWSSALALVAGLHLAGSCPNIWMVEMDQVENPLISEMLTQRIDIDPDGYATIPTGPGLGVELNEDFVQRHRVD